MVLRVDASKDPISITYSATQICSKLKKTSKLIKRRIMASVLPISGVITWLENLFRRNLGEGMFETNNRYDKHYKNCNNTALIEFLCFYVAKFRLAVFFSMDI